MSQIATILHIEDDPIVSGALAQLIASWPDIRHVGATSSGAEGLELCRERRPDVVLLDLRLADGGGFRLVSEISSLKNPPRILLLTGVVSEVVLFRLSDPGISGLIWKYSFAPESLRRGITEALAGRKYFSPEIRTALEAWRRAPDAFFKILSPRELELLPLFARGDTDAEIAERVGRGATTVRSHRQHILSKLGLHSTEKLMRWSAEKGFAEFPKPAAPCPTVRD